LDTANARIIGPKRFSKMIDKCEEQALKLDNKIINLPRNLKTNMQNRLIKVIQKKEDAENGVKRKEKFQFKSQAKKIAS